MLEVGSSCAHQGGGHLGVYLQLIDTGAAVAGRDAYGIRLYGNAERVVVAHVCTPATNAASRLPDLAPLPQLQRRVTARRRAVLHRDLATSSVRIHAGRSEVAGELDANDRSYLWQQDTGRATRTARNPRERVAVLAIIEVVPAVNPADADPGRPRSDGVSSPYVCAIPR